MLMTRTISRKLGWRRSLRRICDGHAHGSKTCSNGKEIMHLAGITYSQRRIEPDELVALGALIVAGVNLLWDCGVKK
jgi:hypothetical protein